MVTARVDRRAFAVDVNLTIAAGSVHALVGPNGAGKSTVADLLAGALRPDHGTVRIGDADVTALPPRRRPIGYLDQRPRLFPHLGAADNIAFGLRARGLAAAPARAIARDWLERVGLPETARTRPGDLSGGQRARIALARALAPAPAVLLLDEPFAALSVDGLPGLRDLLRDAVAEHATSVLLISHDPIDAWLLADTLSVLVDGRIVETGPVASLLTAPGHAFTARLAGLNLRHGPGGPVVFAPAEVRLAAPGTSGWAGTVRSLEPSPSGVRVTVATEAEDIVAQVPFGQLGTLAPGSPVVCVIAPPSDVA